MAADKPEHEETLWWLAASPAIWALHLLSSYATVAIWCAHVATRGGTLGPARTAVAVYTVVALAGIGATAIRAYRRHTAGGSKLRHATDTAMDRHRFIGWATFVVSVLAAMATVYVALPFFFFRSCR